MLFPQPKLHSENKIGILKLERKILNTKPPSKAERYFSKRDRIPKMKRSSETETVF